jgi:1-aminocyclopropane-1-carboxylate deaminase
MLSAPQATPVQEIHDPALERAGVRLLVKRLDLTHPDISGNKWYKLKYNLRAAREQGHDTLLSFGGPWSNHIHALAAAGHEHGFRTIGVIRGDEPRALTPTLQFARDNGMMLRYLNRSDYRRKRSPEIVERLQDELGAFYLIPEGGSNASAVQGCAEIVSQIDQPFDVLACACGTGGTLAGLVTGLNGSRRALGVAVLKGAGFLYDDIQALLSADYDNWCINLDYHFGGYAKTTPELIEFMHCFEQRHAIPLEQVYTAKLFHALLDLAAKGEFARGTTVMALHSGGLQGRVGLTYSNATES